MPNRKLELAHKYKTAPQVRKLLGLSRFQLDIRIDRRILPGPTLTDASGVRYFDDNWVRIAKEILQLNEEAAEKTPIPAA